MISAFTAVWISDWAIAGLLKDPMYDVQYRSERVRRCMSQVEFSREIGRTCVWTRGGGQTPCGGTHPWTTTKPHSHSQYVTKWHEDSFANASYGH